MSVWRRIYLGALLTLVVWLFTGCVRPPAATAYRLGPGERVIFSDGQSIICAGQDCEIKRVWR